MAKKNKTYKKMMQQQKVANKRKEKIVSIFVGVVVLAAIVLLVSFLRGAVNSGEIPSAENRPFTGPEDAQIVFLEFGCYTCPLTKQFNLNVVNRLIEEFGDEVKFVFRTVPIARNIGSELAATAARCADEQGLFWEYSDLLFASSSYTRQTMLEFGNRLNLDISSFEECLDSGRYSEEIREDLRDARRAGINITPTVFINDVRITGIHDISLYRRVINDLKLMQEWLINNKIYKSFLTLL